MSEEKYKSRSQQRILKVLQCLSGNDVYGLAPVDVAKACNTTPDSVTRDLANLKIAGLAELLPDTKRWRLSPKIVQIALAHMHALDRAEKKLKETKQRFGREPK